MAARLALAAGKVCPAPPPWPDVWIAAGRRSAPFTAAVRELSGGKTLTVQVLDPKSSHDAFDLIVVPEHDELDGPNVIRTVGAPSYFSPDNIEDAGQAFADLADDIRHFGAHVVKLTKKP